MNQYLVITSGLNDRGGGVKAQCGVTNSDQSRCGPLLCFSVGSSDPGLRVET